MMSAARLRRNRDFQILCGAQGLSRLGTQMSGIAIPLLILRITRSPADAGLVGFAEGVALAVALLPGGAVADRWHRRTVMLISDAGCLAMTAALVAAISIGHVPIALFYPVAVTLSALGALYYPASSAAFRLIVSNDELPTAVAVNQARNAAVVFAGPALGGLLFQVSPVLPFVADAASYGCSLLATLALRTPLPAAPSRGDRASLLHDIGDGLKFVLGYRFLRSTLMNAAVLNFAFEGIFLCLIVKSVKEGSSGLATGSLIAFVGAGSLIGSLMAPLAQKRLSLRQVFVSVTWLCTATVIAMSLTGSIPLLAALIGTSALLIPVLNVISSSAQTLVTPNALQGRMQSAISFTALCMTPLGSVIAGFLLARWTPAVAFLAFAAPILALAVANTRSDALHMVPATPESSAPEIAQPSGADS